MCIQEHPKFRAELKTLTDHWSVGGFKIIVLLGKAVRLIHRARQRGYPHGLITRNVTTSGGTSTTIHYVHVPSPYGDVVCIVNDERSGARHCLDLLVIDSTGLGDQWILHPDPFRVAADRA
ncbi:hypothetical protein IP91_00883 [Pseudoduganella lurida]|uniref:Uncharacterized protein n=1 Tax=Pseudoduganella lurida TaxID=1036180 RepID=A0A562RN10_9BURK|nr:hypothetical protein [Pseudoduganella lurida]TWI69810.1 hypothetical protein IP91_00883 [Pseudoduganella lurida]